MAEEILSKNMPVTAEENPSDVKAVITEAKSSKIAPNSLEETCHDVKSSVITPLVSEEEKDVSDIHEITKAGVKSSRRFSTGIIGAASVKRQVQPRYLGHSMSSCHDLCKYGVKQDSALKPWKITRKKMTGVQSGGEDVDKIGNLDTGMKNLPDKSIKREKHSLVAKKPIVPFKSFSSIERGVVAKCCNNLQSPKGASSEKTSIKVGKKIKEYEESAADLSISTKTEMRKRSRVMGISLRNEKKGVILPSDPSSPKLTLRSVTRINLKNTNSDSLSKEINNVEKTNSCLVNNEDVEEKILHVVESSIRKKHLKVAQCKIQQGPSSSSPGKKIIRRGQNDLIPHKQSPSLSLSPESRLRRHSKSSASNPSLYEQIEKSSQNSGVIMPIENNRWTRRIGIKLTPILSFRSAKVVDSKPVDSSPRRLKFRTRVFQENPDGNDDKLRIKLNSTQDRDGKTSCTEIKQEQVVLRHMKLEGKKNPQTLFNNVIKETASKLVEVRKSKVKALVGAFESVISLQSTNHHHELVGCPVSRQLKVSSFSPYC